MVREKPVRQKRALRHRKPLEPGLQPILQKNHRCLEGLLPPTYPKGNGKVTGEEAGSMVFPPLDLHMPLPGERPEHLDAAPDIPPPLNFEMPLPSPPESRRKSEEKPVIDEPPAPKQRKNAFKFPFFKNGVAAPQQDDDAT
ncbi:hypothetical protein MRX96_004354 [Rhipicephalus microplus]